MKLVKRYPYSNLYHLKGRKFKSILGGVPNVPYDSHGNLAPLDNEVVITTNPIAKYVIKHGPFLIGFHNKQNNRYGTAIKLRTGETLIKRGIGDPVCTPSVIDNRTLQWKYANGSWIREYATEKKVKELIFQKSGQQIKFRYTVNGFIIKKIGQQVDFYKGTRKAFSLQRPYYCTQDGEFISYVNVSWVKVGNDWEVTYPAPSSNKYIDPVIIFGEGAGYIGGDHKDTYITLGNQDRAAGGDADLRIRGIAAIYIPMGRFSLVNHIPTNAIINLATFNGLTVLFSGNDNTAIHRMITLFGVTQIDEGITEDPATGGQPTWRRSFDFNGAGGDVNWAAGLFSLADLEAVADDTVLINALNTWFQWNVTNMCRNWVLNDATNAGWVLVPSTNFQNRLHSQEAIVPANRPYLTVDYDVPVIPPEPETVSEVSKVLRQYKIFEKSF